MRGTAIIGAAGIMCLALQLGGCVEREVV